MYKRSITANGDYSIFDQNIQCITTEKNRSFMVAWDRNINFCQDFNIKRNWCFCFVLFCFVLFCLCVGGFVCVCVCVLFVLFCLFVCLFVCFLFFFCCCFFFNYLFHSFHGVKTRCNFLSRFICI